MSEYQENIGPLEDMQSNIERKRYALDILHSEHNKICLKIAADLKRVEELAKKVYTLESYLSAAECRLAEYDKKEKEWEKEVDFLKKSVDELKLSFEEEERLAEADDTSFDERVIKLIEDRRKDRVIYDSNTSREQMETLQEVNKSIQQESIDLTKALREMKEGFPFAPRTEVQYILENIKLGAFLRPEIDIMKEMKSKQLTKLNALKENVSSLENEIKQLSKQL